MRRARESYDTAALKCLVAVPMVLTALGIDPRGKKRILCPIHGGDNPTAFSFTDTEWYCHRCGVGGDVFDLVREVSNVDFLTALRWLAGVAGIDVGQLPRIDGEQLTKRQKLTRRRQRLRFWRNSRLDEALSDIARLERTTERFHVRLTSARAHGDDIEEWACWFVLEGVYAELETAQWLAARLESEDEQVWAQLWLDEQSTGDVAEEMAWKRTA